MIFDELIATANNNSLPNINKKKINSEMHCTTFYTKSQVVIAIGEKRKKNTINLVQ